MVNPVGRSVELAKSLEVVTRGVDALVAEKVIGDALALSIKEVGGVWKECGGFVKILQAKGAAEISEKTIAEVCELAGANKMFGNATQYGQVATLINKNKIPIADVEKILRTSEAFFVPKSEFSRLLSRAGSDYLTEEAVLKAIETDYLNYCKSKGLPLPEAPEVVQLPRATRIANVSASGVVPPVRAVGNARQAAPTTIGGNRIAETIRASGPRTYGSLEEMREAMFASSNAGRVNYAIFTEHEANVMREMISARLKEAGRAALPDLREISGLRSVETVLESPPIGVCTDTWIYSKATQQGSTQRFFAYEMPSRVDEAFAHARSLMNKHDAALKNAIEIKIAQSKYSTPWLDRLSIMVDVPQYPSVEALLANSPGARIYSEHQVAAMREIARAKVEVVEARGRMTSFDPSVRFADLSEYNKFGGAEDLLGIAQKPWLNSYTPFPVGYVDGTQIRVGFQFDPVMQMDDTLRYLELEYERLYWRLLY